MDSIRERVGRNLTKAVLPLQVAAAVGWYGLECGASRICKQVREVTFDVGERFFYETEIDPTASISCLSLHKWGNSRRKILTHPTLMLGPFNVEGLYILWEGSGIIVSDGAKKIIH